MRIRTYTEWPMGGLAASLVPDFGGSAVCAVQIAILSGINIFAN